MITIISEGEMKKEEEIIQSSDTIRQEGEHRWRPQFWIPQLVLGPASTQVGWCFLPREENQTFLLEGSYLLEAACMELPQSFTNICLWTEEQQCENSWYGWHSHHTPSSTVEYQTYFPLMIKHPNQNNAPLFHLSLQCSGQQMTAPGQNLACHLFL